MKRVLLLSLGLSAWPAVNAGDQTTQWANPTPIADCARDTQKGVTRVKLADLSTADRLLPDEAAAEAGAGAGTRYEFELPEGTEKLVVAEEKRKSRVVGEIITIVKAIAAGEVKAQEENPKKCATYTQQYKRATVKLVAKDKDGADVISRTLTVGPPEHLYLSADMPVSKIKQLSFDAANSKIVEKEKPASFYLGINWQWGDVLTDHPNKEFWNNLSLKLMVKASSKPSESIGYGLAYSFDAGDIFVARVRTLADQETAAGDLDSTQSTVFGLSFNITKGLDWLK